VVHNIGTIPPTSFPRVKSISSLVWRFVISLQRRYSMHLSAPAATAANMVGARLDLRAGSIETNALRRKWGVGWLVVKK